MPNEIPKAADRPATPTVGSLKRSSLLIVPSSQADLETPIPSAAWRSRHTLTDAPVRSPRITLQKVTP